MHNQFLPLLRNEIVKATRRKLPYFGILIVALMSVVFFAMAGRLTSTTANGWSYVGLSMQMLFSDIGPIFITVFSAMLLAEETGNETIRALLASPVQRWEIYLAKAAIGILYAGVVSLIALTCSTALAQVHYRFDAVADSFGVVYPTGAVVREFMIGYVVSFVPLAALVMYGLFISTVVRGSGAAVAVAIGTLYVMDLGKHLIGLDPYIFTGYIGYAWLVLQQVAQGMYYEWQPGLWKLLAVSGGYAAILFAAGLFVFVRQDLNRSA